MVALMAFWVLSSLLWLGAIAQRYQAYGTGLVVVLLGLGLVWLCVKYPNKAKAFYAGLMRHKISLAILALIFQIILLLSATMMIRSDAAVVFNGAIGDLEAHRLASYLTRNPNNMVLFLYERAFYKVFGSGAVWVLQALNIVYTHLAGYLLYKVAKRFANQRVADRVFLFYLLLIVMTPKFMAMYTDIIALPLLAGQLYLVLDLLKRWQEGQVKIWRPLSLGALTGIALLFRPTAAIMIIAFVCLLFVQKEWRKFAIVLSLFFCSFGAVYILPSYRYHQEEVSLIKGEGLDKNWLTFINLGLTFSGTDQEDMKSGLLKYLPEDQRKDYNNGMFKNDYQIAEIKRRLTAYSPGTFLLHTLYKQHMSTGQGNLNWLYKDASLEKTSYTSPLAVKTAKNPLAQLVRAYFIYVDQPNYQYYDFGIQLVWIALSLGLLAFFLNYQDSDQNRLLSLALFGGLLFLQIFEGGKARYLIQFLPQILLLASLGWDRHLVRLTYQAKGE